MYSEVVRSLAGFRKLPFILGYHTLLVLAVLWVIFRGNGVSAPSTTFATAPNSHIIDTAQIYLVMPLP